MACSPPIEVAMDDLALVKIGDGGEPDMGVRAHVEFLAHQDLGRAGLIEEDEGADRPALDRRQNAANGEAAEILRLRNDDGFDQVGGIGVAKARVGQRQGAHGEDWSFYEG